MLVSFFFSFPMLFLTIRILCSERGDKWLKKTARFFPVHLHQQGYNLILSCLELKSVYLPIKPILKQILSHFKIMTRL